MRGALSCVQLDRHGVLLLWDVDEVAMGPDEGAWALVVGVVDHAVRSELVRSCRQSKVWALNVLLGDCARGMVHVINVAEQDVVLGRGGVAGALGRSGFVPGRLGKGTAWSQQAVDRARRTSVVPPSRFALGGSRWLT